jgi:2-methylcitrate dehydratase PrpD
VVIHPIIDACLEITAAAPLDAGQIERIELTVPPLTVKLTDLVEPKDRGQALVSMQHWAAAALVHGAGGIAQVTDAVVRDPAMAQLRRKVTHTIAQGMRNESAGVAVLLKDKRRLEARIEHCRGSVGRPLSDEDIGTKAQGQLETVFPADAAKRILDESWRIGSNPRAGSLCGLLRPEQ